MPYAQRRSRRRPVRRRVVSRYRRRAPRRSSRYGRPTTDARYLGFASPDSVIVQLKLGTRGLQLPGAPNDRVTLKGNDVFAPDPAHGSSRQPIGYDQWATQYKKYEVLSSAISTRVVNISTTGVVNWCAYPSFDFTDITYGDAIAQRYSKSSFSDTIGSGQASSRIYSKMGTYKLLGRPSGSLSFTALVTNSPTKTWDWVFEFTNPETTNLQYDFQTNITYSVRFYERVAMRDS